MAPRTVVTTLYFLRNLRIDTRKLECYVTLQWKALLGKIVSYIKQVFLIWAPRTVVTTLYFLYDLRIDKRKLVLCYTRMVSLAREKH